MVNVVGNNHPPARHLIPYRFSGQALAPGNILDLFGNRRAGRNESVEGSSPALVSLSIQFAYSSRRHLLFALARGTLLTSELHPWGRSLGRAGPQLLPDGLTQRSASPAQQK